MRDDTAPVILWFRSDLRLRDHPGVAAALATRRPVLPVFIWDEHPAVRPLGAASRWWLHRSLHALNDDLRRRGSRLIVQRGETRVVLADLSIKTSAKTVLCSHTFEPLAEDADAQLQEALSDLGVDLERHNSTLLVKPGSVTTRDGKPFRVYTPFLRAVLAGGILDVEPVEQDPSVEWPAPECWPDSLTVDELNLPAPAPPSSSDCAKGFNVFTPGESGARRALQRFFDTGLASYDSGRDRPDLDSTSHLSSHLRFGEISPCRILLELQDAVASDHQLAGAAAKFRQELIWREFNYNILYQQPWLHQRDFRPTLDGFPWRDDDPGFRAWTRGQTGYPLVDAGMKQLRRTGYMHNRVRMICASFLVKHLLIDWRRGEQWFWDCLLDADPANNPANWQWVAGSGADAAPYFRIFNPTAQGQKFDPGGIYRRRWVPESKLDSGLFDDQPESGLYPRPIVDHVFARKRALDAYRSLRDDHDDTD